MQPLPLASSAPLSVTPYLPFPAFPGQPYCVPRLLLLPCSHPPLSGLLLSFSPPLPQTGFPARFPSPASRSRTLPSPSLLPCDTSRVLPEAAAAAAAAAALATTSAGAAAPGSASPRPRRCCSSHGCGWGGRTLASAVSIPLGKCHPHGPAVLTGEQPQR